MAQFEMSDYVDVAERIAEFRSKYPDGSLQQVSLDFREFAGKSWVIFTAAAYRTADDARPGHGTAWEPVPGKTPFTRDSELQNAETAAWGRAIVAVLAADTKRGISSREEVQARQESSQPATPRYPDGDPTERWTPVQMRFKIADACAERGIELAAASAKFAEQYEQSIREADTSFLLPFYFELIGA